MTTLVSGLAMGESARWHDGRFWCSDWVAGEILAVDLEGTSEVVARSTSFPFCFDWTRDGTMLVTSEAGLERLDATTRTLVPHADLSQLVQGRNEVIVDPRDRRLPGADQGLRRPPRPGRGHHPSCECTTTAFASWESAHERRARRTRAGPARARADESRGEGAAPDLSGRDQPAEEGRSDERGRR